MKRIVIGVSGASGIPIALEVLRAVKETREYKTDLVITEGGRRTIEYESEKGLEEFTSLADTVHDLTDIGACIASGTYKTEGMIVVPCSMKTVAGIACGYSDNLLLRAADVTIKERRKLVLVARETPFSQIHLKNMYELSKLGVVIMPPVQTYYNKPRNIRDMADHMAGKILDVFGIEYKKFRRWE